MMFILILTVFDVISLHFLAIDFGFFPGAFACDGNKGGTRIPHTALLYHPESPNRTSFTATALHIAIVIQSLLKTHQSLTFYLS